MAYTRILQSIALLWLVSHNTVCGQARSFALTSDSVSTGQSLITRSVFFELGKPGLRPESIPFLDSLVQFLTAHPHVAIDVCVHSDTRTNPNCCSNITQLRAQSISAYLTEKGISTYRLNPKGYGESKLLIRDDVILKAKTKEEKEALHALNRRVEIRISSVTYVPKQPD